MDDPQEKPLTPKQRAFIEHYLTNGFNGTRAALSAGYAESGAHVEAHRLLRNAKIKSEIDLMMADTVMSPSEVSSRLTAFARGDIGDLYDEKTGQIDWQKARGRGGTHLSKKIAHESTRAAAVSAKGEESDVEVFEDRIELHDPMKALALLGKIHGQFTEKLAIQGEINLKAYAVISPSDWPES